MDDLLPELARRFCISSVPGALGIRRAERLRGGLAAVTHLVELDRGGDAVEVVLRRFVRQGGAGWPPIEREVAALDALRGRLLAGAVRAYPDPEMWLPGWIDAGRSDLTADLIRERLRIFVERALSRL